ncbi:MAG: hypothetical protein IKI52_05480 [Clostridia bacterium]|jgi:hypothetical protein|nr:hypothetical protein [Clostridia bacterium]
MKRVLICLLALLLIVPFAASSAEENPMRSLKLTAEADGDLLDVRFDAEIDYPSETAAFESMDFVLTYDQNVLELIELVKIDGVPESDILDSSFIGFEGTETAGRFEYHCASALGHRGSGLLLHLRFRILSGGSYGFRLKREGYSIYDSATNRSESRMFALLDMNLPVADTTPLPEPDLPDIPQHEPPKEEKGWFARLIDSIFGSSCTGGR